MENMDNTTVLQNLCMILILLFLFLADFQDSGELKPGRKGISLSGEQYQRLKAIMGDIDEKLSSV